MPLLGEGLGSQVGSCGAARSATQNGSFVAGAPVEPVFSVAAAASEPTRSRVTNVNRAAFGCITLSYLENYVFASLT
jgi:hypothetical protein